MKKNNSNKWFYVCFGSSSSCYEQMRIIKSNHWHFANWKHWLIVWCSCSSNSSASMNLWFWLQKRICIISAFNFRIKKTLPRERAEKRTLFLSLIVKICQHRENPQIAEGNPFNVRVVTHIKKTVKKCRQTLSLPLSVCACMWFNRMAFVSV